MNSLINWYTCSFVYLLIYSIFVSFLSWLLFFSTYFIHSFIYFAWKLFVTERVRFYDEVELRQCFECFFYDDDHYLRGNNCIFMIKICSRFCDHAAKWCESYARFVDEKDWLWKRWNNTTVITMMPRWWWLRPWNGSGSGIVILVSAVMVIYSDGGNTPCGINNGHSWFIKANSKVMMVPRATPERGKRTPCNCCSNVENVF